MSVDSSKKKQGLDEPYLSRFWSRVDKTGDCWVWTGATTKKGYGHMYTGGRTQYAHRLSFALHIGEVPPGLQVNHRCHNRPCVRPDHLYAGTQSDSMRDRVEAGKNAGASHWRAKLTESQVREIRQASDPYPALSERYGVAVSTICMIKKRKLWAHLANEPPE